MKVNVQVFQLFRILPHTYVELHVTFLRSELFNRSRVTIILIPVRVTTKMDAKKVAFF